MRAQSKWLWLALMASSLVMAGRAEAATRATINVEVNGLNRYSVSRTVRISYAATDSMDASAIDSYDLYVSGTAGGPTLAMTSYDGAPFYFTAPTDGEYTFYVVATNGADMSNPSAVISTKIDTSAPATLDVSRLSVNQEPSLTSGEVIGTAGAVEAGTTVEMYSNASLTTFLRSVKATANGSFGPMTIGGSSVREVWLAARDAAGNRGAAIKLDNNMSYVGGLTSFTLKADGGDAAIATFVAPISAKQFRVQYRHAGGAVWSVDYYTVGVNGTTIRLTGLQAGRAYDVRIAPVDANLNVGQWSMASVRTVGTKVDTVVLASERPVVTTTATTATAATPVTTPAATTETKAEVKSDAAVTAPVTTPAATTEETTVNTPVEETAPAEATNEPATNEAPADNEEQSGSATPWVILAILIVLAGIATGGYFYWFSGPEEVTTAVTPSTEKKADEKTETKAESADDADKRW